MIKTPDGKHLLPIADAPMSLWSIYDHPKDFPHCFVARRYEITRGQGPIATQDHVTATSCDELRDRFASQGMMCLPRVPEDDPNIVETWL